MLFLAILLLIISPCYSTTTVRITNKLSGNLPLTLHCKSKDKDLQVQHIINGGVYEFEFDINLWSTTLFFCGFNWPNSAQLHWFDIFKPKRDLNDCDQFCWWTIQESGPCKIYGALLNQNSNGLINKCYGWNNALV